VDLNDLYSLFALCLSEMPKGHPKPRLVVHESPERMVEFVRDPTYAFQHDVKYPASLVAGMADVERNAIHIPYTTLVTEDRLGVLDVLLHECGHLYYAAKHGPNSSEYTDEAKAGAFARRWMRRLKKQAVRP
jgi:hypothetical protein